MVEDGTRPIYRPQDWHREEKKLDKRGGYRAPIIIPPTPGGEVLGMLKEVAELEAIDGVKVLLNGKYWRTPRGVL
jgi:hypothetical protein